MGRKDEMKSRMWQAGADAFTKLGLDPRKMYVCPLCLRGGDKACLQNGYFTLEHVPPQSAGGRELVLTCRCCNSRAGHEIEGHLAEFEKLRRAKESGEIPLQAKVTTDSVTDLNVKASISSGRISIAGLPKQNPPGTTDALGSELEARYQAGKGMPDTRLEFRIPLNPRKMEIAWLKAGYLAVFAVFGYRYAVRPELKLVREQIKHPNEDLIKGFGFHLNDVASDQRHVVLLREPEWARGIAVQMGSTIILLPFDEEVSAYYSRIAEHHGERVDFNGTSLGWPERPKYEFDHYPGNVTEYLRLLRGD